MGCVNHTGLDDRGNLHLEARLAGVVEHLGPVALGDAVFLGGFGVHGQHRPRIDLAHALDLAPFGMELRPLATAGREDDRVLLGHLGVGFLAEGNGLDHRQRLLAPGLELQRVQLDHAGDGVETGLAIVAQLAGFVLTVVPTVEGEDALVTQLVEGHARRLDLVVHEVFDRFVLGPRFGVQTLAKLKGNLQVGLCLAVVDSLHLGAEVRGVATVVNLDDAVMLDERGNGEEQIAQGHRRRRHEEVLHHVEVHLLAGIDPALRLCRHAHESVAAVEPDHAHRTLIIGELELGQDGIGLDVGKRVALDRLAVVADTALLLLFRNPLDLLVAPRTREGCLGAEHVAARNVNVARDGDEAQNSLDIGKRVGLHLHCNAHEDGAVAAGAVSGGVRAGDRAHLLGRNLRQLLDLLVGVLIDSLDEPIEAVHPLLDKFLVVDALVNDDLQHADSERRVSARAKLQHMLGARAHPGDLGVDDDELRAHLHHVDNLVAEIARRIRDERVRTPNDHVLGALEARIVVFVVEEHAAVDLGIARAEDVRRHHAARAVAGVAGDRRRDVSRAEVGKRDDRVEHRRLTAGTAEGQHSIRGSRLLDNLVVVLLNEVVRLIPGDALPRVLAAILRVALHRVDDALGMILELGHVQAFDAQTPLRDGIALIAFDVDELAVLDVEDGAACCAMAARCRPHIRANVVVVIGADSIFPFWNLHSIPLSLRLGVVSADAIMGNSGVMG